MCSVVFFGSSHVLLFEAFLCCVACLNHCHLNYCVIIWSATGHLIIFIVSLFLASNPPLLFCLSAQWLVLFQLLTTEAFIHYYIYFTDNVLYVIGDQNTSFFQMRM